LNADSVCKLLCTEFISRNFYVSFDLPVHLLNNVFFFWILTGFTIKCLYLRGCHKVRNFRKNEEVNEKVRKFFLKCSKCLHKLLHKFIFYMFIYYLLSVTLVITNCLITYFCLKNLKFRICFSRSVNFLNSSTKNQETFFMVRIFLRFPVATMYINYCKYWCE